MFVSQLCLLLKTPLFMLVTTNFVLGQQQQQYGQQIYYPNSQPGAAQAPYWRVVNGRLYYFFPYNQYQPAANSNQQTSDMGTANPYQTGQQTFPIPQPQSLTSSNNAQNSFNQPNTINQPGSYPQPQTLPSSNYAQNSFNPQNTNGINQPGSNPQGNSGFQTGNPQNIQQTYFPSPQNQNDNQQFGNMIQPSQQDSNNNIPNSKPLLPQVILPNMTNFNPENAQDWFSVAFNLVKGFFPQMQNQTSTTSNQNNFNFNQNQNVPGQPNNQNPFGQNSNQNPFGQTNQNQFGSQNQNGNNPYGNPVGYQGNQNSNNNGFGNTNQGSSNQFGNIAINPNNNQNSGFNPNINPNINPFITNGNNMNPFNSIFGKGQSNNDGFQSQNLVDSAINTGNGVMYPSNGNNPNGDLGPEEALTIQEAVQRAALNGKKIYPIWEDRGYLNSATLPPSQAEWFAKFPGKELPSVLDGMNATCDNSRIRKKSMVSQQKLLSLAQEAVKPNSQYCGSDASRPPPPQDEEDNGIPPLMNLFGTNVAEALQKLQNCKSNPNVGTCGEIDRSAMVESIFAMQDLGDKFMLVSNGIPSHCYTRGNDGGLACESFKVLIVPKKPKYTGRFKPWPSNLDTLGFTVSGSYIARHVFANMIGQCNVVNFIQKWTYGPCDGHANPNCVYHIHKAPVCMKGFDSCKLLGYYIDGHPIYGKCKLVINGQTKELSTCYRLIEGKNGCDETHYLFDYRPDCYLDQANGRYFDTDTYDSSGNTLFKAGTYAYFFTSEYPFMSPGSFGELQTVCNLKPQDILTFNTG